MINGHPGHVTSVCLDLHRTSVRDAFFVIFPSPQCAVGRAAAGDVPWCHACLFPTQHDTRSARDHIQPTRRCPAQRPQGIVGNLSPKRLPACFLGLAAADMLNVPPLCWGARGGGDGGWGGELKKRSCQIAGGPMSAARQTDRCINHTPAPLRVPASPPPPPRCGPTPPRPPPRVQLHPFRHDVTGAAGVRLSTHSARVLGW